VCVCMCVFLGWKENPSPTQTTPTTLISTPHTCLRLKMGFLVGCIALHTSFRVQSTKESRMSTDDEYIDGGMEGWFRPVCGGLRVTKLSTSSSSSPTGAKGQRRKGAHIPSLSIMHGIPQSTIHNTKYEQDGHFNEQEL